ncbi:MAG: AMP-binding protein [Bacteroidales bacterium]|jgi:long-chain acyl-CoA synthetase|nr:AMP-binding protein [Bacteroidales bacterium]
MIRKHDKIAIVYKRQTYSYYQLLQYSSCYGECFSKREHPKKILIYAENSPEWFFAFYGALRCNAIVVPVDVQSTQKELSYIVADCQPDILFVSDNKLEIAQQACQAVIGFDGKILTHRDIDISCADTMEVTEIKVKDENETALIIYTSGTTGSPKGVMLSYRNIIFVANAVSKVVPIFSKESNVMVLLPLHHSFPLMGTLFIPMYMGSTVYIAEGLSSDSILDTLNEGKISIIIGVPRLYETLSKGIMAKINAKLSTKLIYQLLKVIGNDKLSKMVFSSVHKKFGGHIEFLVSGGAALSEETAKIFKTLGFYVLEGYGMTETGPLISFTHPGKRKIGYAGYPLKDMDIKISPAGEICVRGKNVMQGYYQRQKETDDIITDGWLHTGDIGMLDKYGLKITGRIKDIIVTPNGKNINPEEIETEILAASRYIKEVAVFMENSILQAIIFPELKELRQGFIENMRELIKEEITMINKEVPPYKRVKQFHIISEELPKTRLGKIQRFKLPSLISQQKNENVDGENENQSKVYQMLKAFVKAETGYSATANDHFEIDLSMDSLSRVALLSYIETTFNLLLNEEQLETLDTLAKLTAYIEKNSNEITNREISWREILYSRLPDFNVPKSGFIHSLISGLSKVGLHTAYRFKGKGEKNIPDEPCIIVANHRSALDGLIITARMNYKTTQNTFFFAKEKHWRTRFARFMAGKNNVIVMDINKNLKEALQQMSYVLRQGKNVIIFPEGTRSRDNELKQFKETFAILSKELNIPIVPVVIKGSEKAVLRPVKFPRFFARIRVEFLQPVYPEPGESIEILKSRVENSIKQKLQ